MAAIQKKNPDTLVSATDIRSERKVIREKHLNGRSLIETLLDDLSTPDWVFALKRDAENHVQCLFFAHQKQIELLLANPSPGVCLCILECMCMRNACAKAGESGNRVTDVSPSVMTGPATTIRPRQHHESLRRWTGERSRDGRAYADKRVRKELRRVVKREGAKRSFYVSMG
jgi:hypothetical protein